MSMMMPSKREVPWREYWEYQPSPLSRSESALDGTKAPAASSQAGLQGTGEGESSESCGGMRTGASEAGPEEVPDCSTLAAGASAPALYWCPKAGVMLRLHSLQVCVSLDGQATLAGLDGLSRWWRLGAVAGGSSSLESAIASLRNAATPEPHPAQPTATAATTAGRDSTVRNWWRRLWAAAT